PTSTVTVALTTGVLIACASWLIHRLYDHTLEDLEQGSGTQSAAATQRMTPQPAASITPQATSTQQTAAQNTPPLLNTQQIPVAPQSGVFQGLLLRLSITSAQSHLTQTSLHVPPSFQPPTLAPQALGTAILAQPAGPHFMATQHTTATQTIVTDPMPFPLPTQQNESDRHSLRNPQTIPVHTNLALFSRADNSDIIELKIVTDAAPGAIADSEAILQGLLLSGELVKLYVEIEGRQWDTANFAVVLQQLAKFWVHDLHDRCHTLYVILPEDKTNDSQADTASPTSSLLPTKLTSFFFYGNHTHLPQFFSRSTELPHLRTLQMYSNISIENCMFFLQKGCRSLERFEIHNIGDINHTFLGQRYTKTQRTPMTALQSLVIGASCPIAQIFAEFTFPQLEEIDICNSCDIFEVLEYIEPIPNLRDLELVRLHCRMTSGEKIKLEEIGNPNALPIVDNAYKRVNLSFPTQSQLKDIIV
ncbi:hypothetical protein H0H87_005286, partial [Tephrocybe sp. NHM501043]